ncbi:type II toxin-antitoxin system Phd/YefM family antitoxin [Sodalis sp. RH16]|uniref:type II toxin-antitoxin system Phd/YefM family antitoxin n=1 Tax=Sodalis sp. RH16 TaxID=3394331 RepID=UPI0039B6C487
MTVQANMHEAKSCLSQLADKAVDGETVIIAKAGIPYVQLVPILQRDRNPGGYENRITMNDSFNDADVDIQRMFEVGE